MVNCEDLFSIDEIPPQNDLSLFFEDNNIFYVHGVAYYDHFTTHSRSLR